MRSWLTYTAARLGLFAAAFGIVYLFGARSWIALVLAWLISGLASYVLLSKWRDQISQRIVERSEERRGVGLGDRLEDGAGREDHLQDAVEEHMQDRERPADEQEAAGPEQEPVAASSSDEAPESGPKN